MPSAQMPEPVVPPGPPIPPPPFNDPDSPQPIPIELPPPSVDPDDDVPAPADADEGVSGKAEGRRFCRFPAEWAGVRGLAAMARP